MQEQTIFIEALDKEGPAERSAFLDRACEGKPEMRCRVERLLVRHDRAGSFLETPASGVHETLAESLTGVQSGQMIGTYKLLEQIGEGGFGVVFLAEQVQPVRRKVALKVIKPGMDTREVIGRFEAERQALAMMDHPNIAKVHDAGATENGRPYFVMELVPGVPITDYCDQCNLSTGERLELFVAVCQAVQHAHQKGVIHRDLKPTNVLVAMQDGRPAPKIIDFGIAKAIDQRLTEHTLTTAFAQMVGTPLYMSPEQAELRPLGVDTRSDIYSLGVLLYELLTGATPIDKDRLHEASYDELRRIIREEEPPRPSARISTLAADLATNVSERRRTDVRRLQQTVQGELDWIVMKCLEKERNRRYETPNSLARDIERYLHDEAVEACPPSIAYGMKKFVRRNMAGVLAASAVAVAMAVGLALATVGFLRARTEAVRSEKVALLLKDMLASAGPSVARGRDATLLREILIKTAQRIDKDLDDQPEVQGDLWMTLGNTYWDVGDFERAITTFQRAVDSYRRALGHHNAKLALAIAHLGKCQSFSGDVATGKNNANLGLEMARSCDDPETLASCLVDVADSFDFWGVTSQQGVPFLREAVALRKQLCAEPVALADCMQRLAAMLRLSASSTEREESESLHHEALALHREHLGSDHPKVAGDLFGLGLTLLRRGKPDEAETVLQETVVRYRALYDDKQPYQSIVRRYLATSLVLQGKWEEAESVALHASEASPQSAVDWDLLGRVNAYRGEWATAADQFLRASEVNPKYDEYRRAVALLEAGADEEYSQLSHRYLDRQPGAPEHPDRQRAIAFLLLPADDVDSGRIEQIANLSDSTNRGPLVASRTRLDQALAAYRLGQFDVANNLASPAVIEGARLPNRAQAWFIQSLSNARLRRVERARTALAEGDKLLRQFDPAEQADLLEDCCDWAIAKRLRREAVELLDIADPHPATDVHPPSDESDAAGNSITASPLTTYE